MIIYGWRNAHLKSTHSKTAICPGCGTKGSTTFSVLSTHIHIFWIPLFPIGKKGVSQCQHCQNALKAKEMPDDLKQEYRLLKSETRPPLWQFSGLALIFALLVWLTYADEVEKDADLEMLANPQIGDLYKYSMVSNNFSLYKVTNVVGDSLTLCPNEYAVDNISEMKELLKLDSYLLADEFGVSKADLLQWYEDEDIFGIIRR